MINEEHEREVEENNKLLARPSLIKRLLAGLLDILFFFVVFFGLQVVSYYGVYNPLGYQTSIDAARDMCIESGLYKLVDERKIVSKLEDYNEYKTPEENLDESIVYFYSNNERAIKDEKLADYQSAKIVSGVYYLNESGVVVRKEGITDEKAKEELSKLFNEAIKYFDTDPTYIEYLRRPYYIKTFSDITICVITSIIIYLIPMISSKGGETLGQRIFKIAIADQRTNTYAKKSMILVRYLVFAVFNILAPVLLYISIQYLALIPIFITMIMMSFSNKGTTIHGMLSKTYVVMKQAIVKNNNGKNKPKEVKKKEYGLQHI